MPTKTSTPVEPKALGVKQLAEHLAIVPPDSDVCGLRWATRNSVARPVL